MHAIPQVTFNFAVRLLCSAFSANYLVPLPRITPGLLFVKYLIQAQLNYSILTDRNGEALKAVISGLPEQTGALHLYLVGQLPW